MNSNILRQVYLFMIHQEFISIDMEYAGKYKEAKVLRDCLDKLEEELNGQ